MTLWVLWSLLFPSLCPHYLFPSPFLLCLDFFLFLWNIFRLNAASLLTCCAWLCITLSFLLRDYLLFSQTLFPFLYSHSSFVKTRIGLLTETLETWSSIGHGTWPQLMCCALVAVQVPEVRRGRVGALEQGGSLDSDQDSERWGGNKLEALGTRGIHPKQTGGCWTWWGEYQSW